MVIGGWRLEVGEEQNYMQSIIIEDPLEFSHTKPHETPNTTSVKK
jgi:hypothetical protein